MRRRLLIALWIVLLVMLSGCIGPCLPPIASFTACPDGYRNDLDVQFSSTSQTPTGHGLVFFRWDFGDGAKVDDYYGWVSHRYAEPGSYAVSLTVTDDRGVKATVEQTVVVGSVVVLGDLQFAAGYPPRAIGELANRSSYYLYSVSVKVKFYDAQGIRVAETLVDVSSVDPGERVRFIAEASADVGAIASCVAFVESFAAECSGIPIPVPVDRGA